MKNYVLVTGAPGSKWSSVVKNIYWSKDVDQTDYSEERTYWHDADTPGTTQLMHIGAYWDPGMEFTTYDWDGPFNGEGTRIVKSHTFAHQLDHLKDPGYHNKIPNYPIVMVYRNDYECYEWWKLCGEFNITYPLYNLYYKNLDNMWLEIQKQNKDILTFCKNNKDRITRVLDNYHLADTISITREGIKTRHDYKAKGIEVYVYK
jgi:hypothetical protein